MNTGLSELSADSSQTFGLYVHVPFCFYKCPYCDFNTYAVSEVPERRYLEGILSELDYFGARGPFAGRRVETVYFGGGTPSLLSPEAIHLVLEHVHARFGKVASAEVCIEANPGEVFEDQLRSLWDAGVTRVSFGAQSLAEKQLAALGRKHTPEDIRHAVSWAKNCKFENISVDLMFAVPGQSVSELVEDVQQYIELDVPHISTYSLTIEKGTPFYQAYSSGTLRLPEEEEVLEMFRQVCTLLQGRGYERYELSNFGRPAFHSKHNTGYWSRRDYLGLGPGAHSYVRLSPIEGIRWSNLALPSTYSEEAVLRGAAVSWSERLDRDELSNEFFYLGLRQRDGVCLNDFSSEFGVEQREKFQPAIEALLSSGNLIAQDNRIAVAERSILLFDSILEEIFVTTE